MKKVLVALPQEVVDLIDTELKGKLGDGYSDIIRSITLSWLSEKGYLSKGVKNGKK
jgi:metal-responsive CopG/Arc/MetJ family transcriptional regulator